MSIFFIPIIALIARCDFSDLGSPTSSMMTFGTTCHDSPYLSLSQPQATSLPPFAVSFPQQSSTSAWLSQCTTKEIASVNLWSGPPLSAVYSMPSSSKLAVSTLPAGPGPKGSVMTATFELDGIEFVCLNGGPQFKFNEAISFVIHCKTQEEVDELWDKLTSGGGQESMCGWLKDKYGLSWQVVPDALLELLAHRDPAKAQRAMKAMLQMKKIDIKALQQAHAS